MKKYIVNGEHEFFDAREAAEFISTEYIDEDQYADMLDECYPAVQIFGASYSPALVMERVDPVAYRCGFLDFLDAESDNIAWEMERMDDGEELNFYGVTVEAVEQAAEAGAA